MEKERKPFTKTEAVLWICILIFIIAISWKMFTYENEQCRACTFNVSQYERVCGRWYEDGMIIINTNLDCEDAGGIEQVEYHEICHELVYRHYDHFCSGLLNNTP